MVKIFPLLRHKDEFFIEDKFEEEYKKFKKVCDNKKADALQAAGGEKKKMDFDIKRDCYTPEVKQFVFDLVVNKTNSKGEQVIQPEKTVEELNEIEFKN